MLPDGRKNRQRLEPETPERAAAESGRHPDRSCPADQGQSGSCRQQVVADLAGSPLSTTNRITTVSRQSGKYPQGVIGKGRESRLPVSRKSDSEKLESDKNQLKRPVSSVKNEYQNIGSLVAGSNSGSERLIHSLMNNAGLEQFNAINPRIKIIFITNTLKVGTPLIRSVRSSLASY